MPDNFLDFKKQRSRWAFGAMQILRRHFELLILSRGENVTAGQRYHFIAGWLPWLADGFNLIFNSAALVSLSHTIGSPMIAGFVRRDRPFFRTPKRARRHALGEALSAAREEACLMLGLWFAAFAVSRIPSFDGLAGRSRCDGGG